MSREQESSLHTDRSGSKTPVGCVMMMSGVSDRVQEMWNTMVASPWCNLFYHAIRDMGTPGAWPGVPMFITLKPEQSQFRIGSFLERHHHG